MIQGYRQVVGARCPRQLGAVAIKPTESQLVPALTIAAQQKEP